MTDRELLELAAKAAGIDVYESTDGTMQNRPVLVFAAAGGMGTMPYEERWNPLTDDAQALRLAVNLELTIYPPQPNTAQYDKAACQDHTAAIDILEPNSGNPEATTRRAIVRAAAAIGEQMK